MKRLCIVVFPVYKKPTELELNFLENGSRKLSNYDQVIVCSNKLDIDKSFGNLTKLPVVRYDCSYFENIKGYNKLMLNTDFYKSFINYEYILIHQPDVFIFKDELKYWCSKNYSYIGAPWLRKDDSKLKEFINSLRKIVQPKYGIKHNKVGNGGFSLRNVSDFLEILNRAPTHILEEYKNKTHHLYNEDVFWSIVSKNINPLFKIPNYLDALEFGVEFEPQKAYKINQNQLPFGCHAPAVHDLHFWKKHIPILNNHYLIQSDEK